MTNLNDAVVLLQAKRAELLEQLEAIEKALAALNGVGDAGAGAALAAETDPGTAAALGSGPLPVTILPTRLKTPRTLSDDHKHALKEGRRKARHSKEAAKGLARELPDLSPGLAPAPGADVQPPRLVKRTKP